ncbi:MAG: RNA polymerase-associated protein RapA [Desulfobacteraceae bacterium]|jgi:ATP-dependent helicase HepA|nr:RNA polymerase-associated protein RapA [Desulfobacteraceae bacterium]
MNKYIQGQRWISETEPELGLGTITGVEQRTTSVTYLGSNEHRQYAIASAPLKRVRFKPGDKITSRDDVRIQIEVVREINGLLVYCGNGCEIPEYEICDTISFSTPKERLINGLTDPIKLFNLRYETLNVKAKARKSSVRGFLGGRVDLIGHQFYIASEVASRYAPRVLLSDEVGLGKTIEACLIIQRLLECERIRRVLIIVPDALVHQWFVELWRRFNMMFKIFDESFCRSVEKQNSGQSQNSRMNPFLENQLGICSLDFFDNKHWKKQALNAGWDMLVVDEAHHIEENTPAYQFIKSLGQASSGMMLLTATPDQMGERSHFARLKLLDPARYHNFKVFTKHAANFQKIAGLIDQINNGQTENIDFENAASLSGFELFEDKKRFQSSLNGSEIERKKLALEILDRQGTGRVIFRNTRASIGWFFRRFEKLYPLTATSERITLANLELLAELKKDKIVASYDYVSDPRIQFLVDLQKRLANKKILVICSSPEKSKAIEAAVKKQLNVKIGLFNENMTLIQRDRNAAWFSEKDGAQIMICSEIGSEGRNFQFAHHMVMFDLPLNPELLEQRVGRLDRIGQKQDIYIHVPYLKNSAWEILVNWYSVGLGIFENNISGVHHLYKKFGSPMAELLIAKIENDCFSESDFSELVRETTIYRRDLAEKFENGRNRILELNSYHAATAKKLTEEITAIDQSRDLDQFMQKIFDHYGIRFDEISDRTLRLHFNDLTGSEFPVPALGETRQVITFDRSVACTRGEIGFLSWDHPMVTGAMEMLLGTVKGNSSLAIWQNSGNQGIVLEAVFVIECVAPVGLNIDRFLPPLPFRLVVDTSGNNVTDDYPFAAFKQNLKDLSGSWLNENSEIAEILLPNMVNTSLEIAESSAQPIIESALAEIESVMGTEISRLKELKKVNPDIRSEEINIMENEKHSLCSHVQEARFRLDALRIVLMT